MKKIIIILTLSLLTSSNLFAESFKINKFNLWLSENGYHQYLNIEKKPFGSASWTVVEPNCHFTK